MLEYDKALALLAAQAATSLGRQRCLNLRPRTDPRWIAERLQETTEARELLTTPALGPPPFGGVTDQREVLGRAHAGSVLTPSELLAVRDLAAACRRLRQYFERAQDELGQRGIITLGLRVQAYPEIEAAIERCLNDEGELLPEASPELARLLRLRVTLRDRLRERMEALAQQYFQRGFLQDPLVVERGGRLCLPVLATHHSRFEGIVHDRSASGATLFMEPLLVVAQGNELREVELALEEEKKRILAELSALVGRHAEALRADLRWLTALDFIFAKGRLSLERDAHPPALGDYLDLPDARHPLLGKQAVPINFELGRDFRTLVITGPNTGGKTVALKTAGLLTLMAQSGLHIPAGPTCRVPVFRRIYADIGDEQSIEQSLSTFSSHMSQIVKILHQVQAAARRGEGPILVLLDEIGAGTDPTEGTALAQAILEALHEAFATTGGPPAPSAEQRRGDTGPDIGPSSLVCLTAVTTHYNELKAFAYAHEGMENARVDFDPKTLAPTYRLLIGQPGSSNAFAIAQRLGLPRSIVARARERLSQVGRDFVRALEKVERTQADLARARREAEATEREVARLREQHARELQEFHRRRREAMQKGFSEAQEVLRQAQERAAAIIQALQARPKHDAEAERLRRELAEERERLREQEQALQEEMRRAEAALAAPEAPHPLTAVTPGQRVRVAAWDQEGTVLEALGEDRALVQVGAFQVEVPLSDLYPAPAEMPPSPEIAVLQVRKAMTVPAEVHLLGKTVDEAVAELDKYLDDAALAGLPQVRIVHGKGTGALRRGLHAYLKTHPAVHEFHLAPDEEGGEGATIAHLKP